MAFCSKCGSQLNEGEKFCQSCGTPIGYETEEAANPTQPVQTDLSQKIADLNNTADTTAEYDAQDIRNNKAMAILAYLSWLVLIPLFAARESKFARFHCNQGIVLAVAEIIAVIVLSILDGLPLIGWIFNIAGSLLGLVCFLFAILGIINAANGKAKELPIIGKFKILK